MINRKEVPCYFLINGLASVLAFHIALDAYQDWLPLAYEDFATSIELKGNVRSHK